MTSYSLFRNLAVLGASVGILSGVTGTIAYCNGGCRRDPRYMVYIAALTIANVSMLRYVLSLDGIPSPPFAPSTSM